MPPTTAPYGSWVSPISPASSADGGHAVAGGQFVGADVWWLELRPDESGRHAIRRAGADGEPEDVLPAYRAYAGESHGFRNNETIIDAYESELSFDGQVLGFEPPGVPRLDLWRP